MLFDPIGTYILQYIFDKKNTYSFKHFVCEKISFNPILTKYCKKHIGNFLHK